VNVVNVAGGHWFDPSHAHRGLPGEAETAWLSGQVCAGKVVKAQKLPLRTPQRSGPLRGFRPVVRVRDEECLQRLVGEQLAGSLEIVFGDEDLAPAAKGRAPEGPSRRYVGVTVEAVDALAAEETAKSLSRAFVRNDGQPHPFSHKLILALQPRNRLVEDLP
jgi:hypothetical protein